MCSHPLLVLGEKIPESLSAHLLELFPASSDIISELHKPHYSPKLVALQEILEECGIGVDVSTSEGAVSVGQHRVLIFAQHKVMTTPYQANLGFSFLFCTKIDSVMLCRLCWTSLRRTCFKPT